MTPENTGGQTDAVAPPTEPALEKTDEELRRLTVLRLAEHLDIGSNLLMYCEQQTEISRKDRLGPINAAARLLRANAEIARTLAHVAHVEIRRRSIVERIQSLNPRLAALYSKNEIEKKDDMRAELEARLDKLLEASRKNAPKGKPVPEEEAA